MTSTEKIAGLKDWITWISQTSAWRDEASSDVADRAEVGASQWRQTEHYKGDGPLSNHLRLAWARQEIARLEALEHTEAVCGHTRPVPGYGKCLLPKRHMGMHQNEPIAMKPGDSVNGVRLEQAEANDRATAALRKQMEDGRIILRGGTPRILEALERHTEPAIFPREYIGQWVDDTATTEQRLDDFMRDREAAAKPKHPGWQPLDVRCGDHTGQQPASRELVERMVREATSHSLWPVTIEQPDQNEPTSYMVFVHQPGQTFGFGLGYGALSPWARERAETMATLIDACTTARKYITLSNSDACPACNGQGKTRGYFFGEKQCPDCEGTGVR